MHISALFFVLCLSIFAFDSMVVVFAHQVEEAQHALVKRQCFCGPKQVECACAGRKKREKESQHALVKRQCFCGPKQVECACAGRKKREEEHALVKRQCFCGPKQVECACAGRKKREAVEDPFEERLSVGHVLVKRQCYCGPNQFFPTRTECPCAGR